MKLIDLVNKARGKKEGEKDGNKVVERIIIREKDRGSKAGKALNGIGSMAGKLMPTGGLRDPNSCVKNRSLYLPYRKGKSKFDMWGRKEGRNEK
jgi:hypothetical protein